MQTIREKSITPPDARDGVRRLDDALNRRVVGNESVLAEVRALRGELVAVRKLFDEFCTAYLNARFPHGRPTDRWGRR